MFTRDDGTQLEVVVIRWWLPTKTNANEIFSKHGGFPVDKNGSINITNRIINGNMVYDVGKWFVMFADGYRLAKLPVCVNLFDDAGNPATFTGEQYKIDIHPGLGAAMKFDSVCDMTINVKEEQRTAVPTSYIKYNARMSTATIGAGRFKGGKYGAANNNEIDSTKPTLTIVHNDSTAPDYHRVIPDTSTYVRTVSLNPKYLGDLAKMCNDATSITLHFASENSTENPVYVTVSDGGDTAPVFVVMPMMVK
jgi:hypothetical protein